MTAVTLTCGNDKDTIWLLRTTEQCSFTLQNDLNSYENYKIVKIK